MLSVDPAVPEGHICNILAFDRGNVIGDVVSGVEKSGGLLNGDHGVVSDLLGEVGTEGSDNPLLFRKIYSVIMSIPRASISALMAPEA